MNRYDIRVRRKVLELHKIGLSIRTIADLIEVGDKKVSKSYVHKVLKEEGVSKNNE